MSSPRTARGKPPRTSLQTFRTAQKKGIATGASTGPKKSLHGIEVDSRSRITPKGNARNKSEVGPFSGDTKAHNQW